MIVYKYPGVNILNYKNNGFFHKIVNKENSLIHVGAVLTSSKSSEREIPIHVSFDSVIDSNSIWFIADQINNLSRDISVGSLAQSRTSVTFPGVSAIRIMPTDKDDLLTLVCVEY